MSLPPLQSLLDLLPDNTTGQIQPVDLRNITESLYNGIADITTEQQDYLRLSGGEMTGYLTLFNDPQLPKHAATKRYVDAIAISQGYLLADGSIPMQTGYIPTSPFDIATKQYVENNGLPLGGTTDQILTKLSATDQDAAWQDAPASGQEWSIGTDGQTIEAGQAKYVTTAGDEIFIPDTDKLISLIVTDGSGQASTANPIQIKCDGTPNTFDDGSTLFELDLAGASVEFALLNNVWRLVNFGRILPQNAVPFDPEQDLVIDASWEFLKPLTAKIIQPTSGNAVQGGVGFLKNTTNIIEHHIGSNTGAGNFVYSHGMVSNDLGIIATEDGIPVQMNFQNDATSMDSAVWQVQTANQVVSEGDTVTRQTIIEATADAKKCVLDSDGIKVGGSLLKDENGAFAIGNAGNSQFTGLVGSDNQLEYGQFNVNIVANTSGMTITGQLNISAFNQAGNADQGVDITISQAAIQPALNEAGVQGWAASGRGIAVIEMFTNSDFTTDTTTCCARVFAEQSNNSIRILLAQNDFRDTNNNYVNIQSGRIFFSVTVTNITWA